MIKTYTNVGDQVAGDQLRIECRTVGKWKLKHKSGNHKGSFCTIKKDAKATIEKAYTNTTP